MNPSFYHAGNADKVFRVEYERICQEALQARKHFQPSAQDKKRVCFMIIDAQNTFCIPGFELYVSGAEKDSARTAEFIYKNMNVITNIKPTMDTHAAMQIFHSMFLVDGAGKCPAPMTMISVDDVKTGKWKVNPAVAVIANGNYMALQNHLLHYVEELAKAGKYQLCIWPHHAMLGGIGHALVGIIEEACFFHGIARGSNTDFRIKGGNPLTENYSVLAPEVLTTHGGKPIDQRNTAFIQALMDFDYIVIAGQAKSHCVASSIDDLLGFIVSQDPQLAKKVYLLEDCTSPVVIPGIVDFTQPANEAFQRFATAGMNIVKSTDDIKTWPGIVL
jgi:nicotinamidase-related amidase